MECIDDCHRYVMDTVLGIEYGSHKLTFYEMDEDGRKRNGVTNREVLEVLVHRIKKLQDRVPCFENERMRECLEAALVWDTIRTQDRKAREVEGTNEP